MNYIGYAKPTILVCIYNVSLSSFSHLSVLRRKAHLRPPIQLQRLATSDYDWSTVSPGLPLQASLQQYCLKILASQWQLKSCFGTEVRTPMRNQSVGNEFG